MFFLSLKVILRTLFQSSSRWLVWTDPFYGISAYGDLYFSRQIPHMPVASKVVVNNHSQGGSLWGKCPVIQHDGAIVGFSHDGARVLIKCCAWDPIERGRLAVADGRGNVFVLNMKGNRYSLIARVGYEVLDIVFSTAKRGEIIAALSNRTIVVLSTDKPGNILYTLRGHPSRVQKLAFSESHQSMLASSSADCISVWSTPYTPGGVKNSRFEVRYSLKSSELPAISVNLTTSHLITCHSEAVCVWDLAGPNLIKEMSVPSDGVHNSKVHTLTCMAVTPCGSHVAAGGSGSPGIAIYGISLLSLWRIVDSVGQSHLPGVVQLEFIRTAEQPDPLLAVVGTDGSIYLLDVLRTGDPLLVSTITKPGFPVDSIKLLDDQYMAAISGTQLQIIHLPTARVFSSVRASELTPSSEATSVGSYFGGLSVPGFIAPKLGNRSTSTTAKSKKLKVMHPIPLASSIPPKDQWMKSDLRTSAVNSRPRPIAARHHNPEAGLGLLYQTDINIRNNALRQSKRGTKSGKEAESASLSKSVVKKNNRRVLFKNLTNTDKVAEQDLKIQVNLDTKAISLNTAKLKRMLLSFGQYPEKYRNLIWLFQLHIAPNRTTDRCFTVLLNKGPNAVVKKMLKAYPLSCAKLNQAMEKVIECLVHHCPVLSMALWLPELVFPITKAFCNNVKSSFECTLTYLMNWGRYYLSDYPHYSFKAVLLLNSLLEQLSPDTLETLQSNNCSVEMYAWGPMVTLFTELLSKCEWLQLMDHVFSNQPLWLFAFHCAYLECVKDVINSTKSPCDNFFKKLFSTNNPIDLNVVIQRAYAFHRAVDITLIPEEVNALHYTVYVPLDTDSPYPIITEYPEAKLNAAVLERNAIIDQEARMLQVQENNVAVQKSIEESEKRHERRILELQHRNEAAKQGIDEEARRYQEISASKEKIVAENIKIRLRKAALAQKTALAEQEAAATRRCETIGRLQTGLNDFDKAVTSATDELTTEELLVQIEERAQRQYDLAMRCMSTDGFPVFDDRYTDIIRKGSRHTDKGTAEVQPHKDADRILPSTIAQAEKATMTNIIPTTSDILTDTITTSTRDSCGSTPAPELKAPLPTPERQTSPPETQNVLPEHSIGDAKEENAAEIPSRPSPRRNPIPVSIGESPPRDQVNPKGSVDPAVFLLSKLVDREVESNYQAARNAIKTSQPLLSSYIDAPTTAPTTTVSGSESANEKFDPDIQFQLHQERTSKARVESGRLFQGTEQKAREFLRDCDRSGAADTSALCVSSLSSLGDRRSESHSKSSSSESSVSNGLAGRLHAPFLSEPDDDSFSPTTDISIGVDSATTENSLLHF